MKRSVFAIAHSRKSYLLIALSAFTVAACQDTPTEPTPDDALSSASFSTRAGVSAAEVYVTNIAAGGVQIVSTTTHLVEATVPVDWPLQVAITPDGGYALVTNFSPPSLKVIDTAARSTLESIPLPASPFGVAISPDGAAAFVTEPTTGTLHSIDLSSRTVTSSTPVGAGSNGVAVTPDGRFTWVTNFGEGSVSVVDNQTGTEIDRISVAGRPWGIAFSPNGRRAYVTHQASDQVSVIETNSRTVVQTVTGFVNPSNQPAVSPDGKHLWVANFRHSGEVTVLSTKTNSPVVTIPVGTGPRGVAITPDGERVYVTNVFSGSMSVIRTVDHEVIAEIDMGGTSATGPTGIAILPGSRQGRTTICHVDGQGGVRTLEVSRSAVSAHRGHGDAEGTCEG